MGEIQMSDCRIKATHNSKSRLILETDAKMKFCVFIIVCVFPQISHLNPIRRWTILPHVLIAEVDGTKGWLPLSCLQPEELTRRGNESLDIFWKNNGESEAQRGNVYQVWLVESQGGGNYTCHSRNGSLLNYTEVLIQEEKIMKRKILVKTGDDYLKCSAQNYNGELSCSWTWHHNRVGTVLFIRARRAYDSNDSNNTQCSVDTSGQHWSCSSLQSKFRCSVDQSGNSISCLDKQHCPYAEESQQIHITVYVKTKHFLVENYSRQFYLSGIVKPDKVQINKVNTTMIEWSYPSSWSSPFSYFPLTFQVAQFKRECKSCVNPCTDSQATRIMTVQSTGMCQFKVKHRSKAVCVRAKDALCDSQWSEWSHLRLKIKKKNKKNKKHV